MSEQEKNETEKLVDAYEQLLKQTQEAVSKAQNDSVPKFREMLEKSRDRMVELGELSREEGLKVAEYIRRDIEDAATYVAETGHDFQEWWGFDMKQVEQRLLALFTLATDQTRLQLAQLSEATRQMSLYRTGEITGPGTLVCDKCGAEVNFVRTGEIPVCPVCGARVFHRPADNKE